MQFNGPTYYESQGETTTRISQTQVLISCAATGQRMNRCSGRKATFDGLKSDSHSSNRKQRHQEMQGQANSVIMNCPSRRPAGSHRLTVAFKSCHRKAERARLNIVLYEGIQASRHESRLVHTQARRGYKKGPTHLGKHPCAGHRCPAHGAHQIKGPRPDQEWKQAKTIPDNKILAASCSAERPKTIQSMQAGSR